MTNYSPHVILHTGLASEVFSRNPYDKYIEICYGLWMDARDANIGGTFEYEIFIQRAQELFGYSRQHIVRNILPSGNYHFWTINKGKLTIWGKEKVFDHFGLDPLDIKGPGKAVKVSRDKIFCKLSELRATLFDHTVAGTIQSKRTTMVKNYHRTPQTFYNYQKTAGTKTIHNFTKEVLVNPDTGEVHRKQLPNYYIPSYETIYPDPIKTRYGFIKRRRELPGSRSEWRPLYPKRYFEDRKKLDKWLSKGWLEVGSIVYVKNKFHKPGNGFWYEWDVVYVKGMLGEGLDIVV